MYVIETDSEKYEILEDTKSYHSAMSCDLINRHPSLLSSLSFKPAS